MSAPRTCYDVNPLGCLLFTLGFAVASVTLLQFFAVGIGPSVFVLVATGVALMAWGAWMAFRRIRLWGNALPALPEAALAQARERVKSSQSGRVRLSSEVTTYQTRNGTRKVEYWKVNLAVDPGDHGCPLGSFKGSNALLYARRLAEQEARTLHLPLEDTTPEGGAVVIAPEDLDLPFSQRARKYPHLLETTNVPASPTGIRENAARAGARVFSWGMLTWGTAKSTALVLALALGASFVPGRHSSTSIFTDCQRSGNYTFYVVLPVVAAVALLFMACWRTRLTLATDGVRLTYLVAGIPVRARSLSPHEIEQVETHRGTTQPVLLVVADRAILRARTWYLGRPDAQNAAWLSHHVSSYLMNLG